MKASVLAVSLMLLVSCSTGTTPAAELVIEYRIVPRTPLDEMLSELNEQLRDELGSSALRFKDIYFAETFMTATVANPKKFNRLYPYSTNGCGGLGTLRDDKPNEEELWGLEDLPWGRLTELFDKAHMISEFKPGSFCGLRIARSSRTRQLELSYCIRESLNGRKSFVFDKGGNLLR